MRIPRARRRIGRMSDETSPEPAATDAPSLEARLRRLEEIVAALDSDGLELEKALAMFEEGVGLVRGAEALLQKAELRVEELLGAGERTEAVSFEEQEDD